MTRWAARSPLDPRHERANAQRTCAAMKYSSLLQKLASAKDAVRPADLSTMKHAMAHSEGHPGEREPPIRPPPSPGRSGWCSRRRRGICRPSMKTSSRAAGTPPSECLADRRSDRGRAPCPACVGTGYVSLDGTVALWQGGEAECRRMVREPPTGRMWQSTGSRALRCHSRSNRSGGSSMGSSVN